MERVRNFLFSIVNKEFLTFLFFLALSMSFWFMMTLNETYEQEIDVPVRITNIPQNVVVTSEEIDTVRVKVSGKGLPLLQYLYVREVKPIEVDFKTHNTGKEVVVLTSADLQQMLITRFSNQTRVDDFAPTTVEFFYNNGISKRVPVRWTGHVKPEAPYFISETRITPDSVDIYASARQLDSITVVETEPINNTGFRNAITISQPLKKTKGAKTIPTSVNITFDTDILTETVIRDVPIRGINTPKGKVLRTFPSKTDIHFVVGVNRLRSLTASDFDLVVDYNEIADSKSPTCRVRILNQPDGVSKATPGVTQADYLIEK